MQVVQPFQHISGVLADQALLVSSLERLFNEKIWEFQTIGEFRRPSSMILHDPDYKDSPEFRVRPASCETRQKKCTRNKLTLRGAIGGIILRGGWTELPI